MHQFAVLLAAGGPIVAVLVLLSLLVTTLALVKIWQFCRFGLYGCKGHEKSVACLQHWRKSEFDQARMLVADVTHPRAQVLSYAAGLLTAGRLQGQPLIDEINRYGISLLAELRNYLRPIEVIAALTPLIGLLGTVLGMIEAFQAMEAAGKNVDPSVLSGGIWQALLTTAVGLIVAIPATLLHNWFERKLDVSGQQMADSLGEMLAIEAASDRDGILPHSFPRAIS